MTDSSSAGVASLVPGKSDVDKAKAYRERLQPLLDQCVVVINEASRDGLILGFNLNRDQLGIMRVGDIQVTKPL